MNMNARLHALRSSCVPRAIRGGVKATQRDLHDSLTAKRLISPVAIGTTGTGKTGVILDTQGYRGVEFIIDYGTVTATNAAFTLLLTECDTTGGSFTSVADVDMLPQTGAEAYAALGQAATRTSGVSKNVTTRFGYIGSKRYTKLKVSSTVTAGAPVSVTALLHHPMVAPVA